MVEVMVVVVVTIDADIPATNPRSSVMNLMMVITMLDIDSYYCYTRVVR